jgi:hypothetical protein
VCVDVRKDSSRPHATNEELAFVRYKIIDDRKFVTLVIPKSEGHNQSFRKSSGPNLTRSKADAAAALAGGINLEEALRTHHKEKILTFENEPPECVACLLAAVVVVVFVVY